MVCEHVNRAVPSGCWLVHREGGVGGVEGLYLDAEHQPLFDVSIRLTDGSYLAGSEK